MVDTVTDTRIICPDCKRPMNYIEEDHYFCCPVCDSEFWVPDHILPCPACGKTMKKFPQGCFRCTACKGEYWPGRDRDIEATIWRDPATPPLEPQDDLKARCYHGGQIDRKGQNKGRKRKDKPKSHKAVSSKYLGPYP